jgi:hypothetical protein
VFAKHDISTFRSLSRHHHTNIGPFLKQRRYNTQHSSQHLQYLEQLMFPIDRECQLLNTQKGHIRRPLLALYCFYINIHNNNFHKATTTAAKQQRSSSKEFNFRTSKATNIQQHALHQREYRTERQPFSLPTALSGPQLFGSRRCWQREPRAD